MKTSNPIRPSLQFCLINDLTRTLRSPAGFCGRRLIRSGLFVVLLCAPGYVAAYQNPRPKPVGGVPGQQNEKVLRGESSDSHEGRNKSSVEGIRLQPVKWGKGLLKALFWGPAKIFAHAATSGEMKGDRRNSDQRAQRIPGGEVASLNQADDPLAPIPTSQRSRFSERLTLLVRYQGTRQWAKMYDLSPAAIREKQNKEDYVRHLEKLNIDPPVSTILDFITTEAIPLGEGQGKVGWQILGCATFSEKGKIVEIKASATAELQNDEWFFSEVGAAMQIDGAEEGCQAKTSASADGTAQTLHGQDIPKGFGYPPSPGLIEIQVELKSDSLSGKVTGPSENPLSSALVERVNDSWNERLDAVFTDAKGSFTFEETKNGLYFLQVSKSGFDTQRLKVRVSDRATNNLKIGLTPSN